MPLAHLAISPLPPGFPTASCRCTGLRPDGQGWGPACVSLSSVACGPLSLLLLLQHILASGRFSHLSRWVCCGLVQPLGQQTEQGRGCVLCSTGISLQIPNLVFSQGSRVWATEKVGEANPPLGSLNLEDLGELTGFQDALKLSARLWVFSPPTPPRGDGR